MLVDWFCPLPKINSHYIAYLMFYIVFIALFQIFVCFSIYCLSY